jgi:hypothetical protein
MTRVEGGSLEKESVRDERAKRKKQQQKIHFIP